MNTLTKNRIEILMLFSLYLVILPQAYMVYDMKLFQDWALFMHQHGLQNTYDLKSVNYPPVYLYGLYVYNLFQGSEAAIIHNINYLKIIYVFFDFLPVFVLCCFRQKIL